MEDLNKQFLEKLRHCEHSNLRDNATEVQFHARPPMYLLYLPISEHLALPK
jgi:hypothetical protein